LAVYSFTTTSLIISPGDTVSVVDLETMLPNSLILGLQADVPFLVTVKASQPKSPHDPDKVALKCKVPATVEVNIIYVPVCVTDPDHCSGLARVPRPFAELKGEVEDFWSIAVGAAVVVVVVGATVVVVVVGATVVVVVVGATVVVVVIVDLVGIILLPIHKEFIRVLPL
jgi:hypothetical protein